MTRPSSAADFGEEARIVYAQRVCAPPKSVNRAGHPKGHVTANMVLGHFAETKGPRPPGRNPAIQKIVWIFMRKNQDGFPIKNVGNDRVGERLFVVRPVVDSLEKCRTPFEC